MSRGPAKILCVVPARGNSKGIPRKNLRYLNGKPLLHHTLSMLLALRSRPDVVVSSEDEEVLALAGRLGVRAHKRPANLSNDDVTLDEVVLDATQAFPGKHDCIVTVQPTSPLLKSNTLDSAIAHFLGLGDGIDTLLSVKAVRGLSWRKEGDRLHPNYIERLNRQWLPDTFYETGSFLICNRSNLEKGSRLGSHPDVFLIPPDEAIDIDHWEDWALCESILRRKRIVYTLKGNEQFGLGHAYNAITLANFLVEHELIFLTEAGSSLAANKLRALHYQVVEQISLKLEDDVRRLKPDVVINDILDTTSSYMEALRSFCKYIINFEDLGDGKNLANLVFNAIYPERDSPQNHFFGPAYFCLREEFKNRPPRSIQAEVKEVLLSFGGTDPCNLTQQTLDAIRSTCSAAGIVITVVLGLGYAHPFDEQFAPGEVTVIRNTSSISDHFAQADLAFTSAGRTIYEAAALGVPTIVMAQNERELTHLFASPQHGFLHLGLGNSITSNEISAAFSKLISNQEQRRDMARRMLSADLQNGSARVERIIQQLLSRGKYDPV